MIELFEDGGVMMWPILLGLVAVVVVAARGAMSMTSDPHGGDARSAADAVLFWGFFSALLGLLGTLIGITQAAGAIGAAGGASPALIWVGIGVTLTTSLFGLVVLLLALVAWYGLRTVASRRGRAEATG